MRPRRARTTRPADPAGPHPEVMAAVGSPTSRPYRILLLFLLLLLLDLWAGRNLGISLEDQRWLGPLLLAGGAVTGVVNRVVRQAERESLRGGLDRAAELALHPRVLWIGFTLLIVLAAFGSSITVIGDSTEDRLSVVARPLAHLERSRTATLGPNLSPARFRGVLTSPLGRAYRVDAPGYQPATFQVYPLTGLTVRLGRDIRRVPAVLFRPPPRALGSLSDPDARFVVLAVDGDRRDTVAVESDSSSFLLGEVQPVPADVRAQWPLELTPYIAEDASRTQLRWLHPHAVQPRIPLQDRMVLQALVLSRVGDTMAVATVRLRSERFVDVPMQEVR